MTSLIYYTVFFSSDHGLGIVVVKTIKLLVLSLKGLLRALIIIVTDSI